MMLYRRAFEKERHVRMLVTIGVCGAILGAASACTTCKTPANAGIRAGSNTVGFGNRAGAPNYYCQPGVCKRTGWTIRIIAFVLAGSVPKPRRAQRQIRNSTASCRVAPQGALVAGKDRALFVTEPIALRPQRFP